MRYEENREYGSRQASQPSGDLPDTEAESIYENGRTADHEASERRDTKEILNQREKHDKKAQWRELQKR